MFVSAIYRGVPWCESGLVWEVDNTSFLVKRKECINNSSLISKPEVDLGGHRSARGMCMWGGFLWVAGYHFLAKLSSIDLSVIDVFYNDSCFDIHQIYSSQQGIIVISTGNDSVFIFDGSTFTFLYSLTHLYTNEKTGVCSDTLHLNSLLGKYAVLCSYNGVYSAVVDINKHDIVFMSDLYIYGHDLCKVNENFYLTNSSGMGKILKFSPYSNKCEVMFDYNSFRKGSDSQFGKWGWLRGMEYIKNKDLLLVGVAPASVLVFENVSCSSSFVPVKEVVLHSDVNVSVFDLLWGIR